MPDAFRPICFFERLFREITRPTNKQTPFAYRSIPPIKGISSALL
jgi:hypothetical protein